MKKRTGTLLVISIVLVFALVGGATLAYFSATQSNANNLFTSGTLEIALDRDNGDSVPGPMFYTTSVDGVTPGNQPGLYPTGYWKPGDTFHRVLQAENTGTVDGTLDSVKANLASGSRDLADKLQVTITTDADGSDVIAAGTLGEFIDYEKTFNTPQNFDQGSLVNLHFWITLPYDAGNPYQGLDLVASFTVTATQK